MNPPPASAADPGPLGRVARAVAVGALAYWGLFALVAPVLTIDAHMYNLARLELALRGGFFNSDYFTSVFHVVFPWTFDAVHLPFLLLGRGAALPSFLCLAGTMLVVFRLLRARFGADAAWLGAASLPALTCLAYQAASTKNDIALLFAGAVWIYARWRWRHEGGGRHLAWMVLALGFMAGAKTTGLVYAGLLGLWTLWEIRSDVRLLTRTTAGLALAVLFFGSVETYVESYRLFGHPLGPPPLVRRLGNSDGLPGAVANFTRHVAGGIYAGPTDLTGRQPGVNRIITAERKLLEWTGLTDRGNDRRFPDRLLFFNQTGIEELSGFGPAGTLALGMLLAAALWWRPRALWWRLAAAGLAALLLVSLTISYNSWNNRYILCSYALGAVAGACLLWETSFRGRAVVRWAWLAVVAVSAAAAPLLSFNRHPAALLQALTDPERLETSAYPIVGEARTALRRLVRAAPPDTRVLLVVHDESVVLPLLRDRELRVIMLRRPVFAAWAVAGQLRPGDLVAADVPLETPGLVLREQLTAPNVYSDGMSTPYYLYQFAGGANRSTATTMR